MFLKKGNVNNVFRSKKIKENSSLKFEVKFKRHL
jgi:hypothetical protein